MTLRLLTTFFLLLFLSLILLVIFSITFNTNLESFLRGLSSSEVRFAIILSFKSACIATFFALLVGIPSAYALSRYNFLGKNVFDTLIDLPVVLPPLLSGLGLLIFFSKTSLGSFINEKIIPIVFSPNGIIVAQFFIATPFVIRTVRAVFETIDEKYEKVAQSLGSSPVESFYKIALPLAKKGLIASAVLAWARCLGEFGATLILAGATKMRTETLPIAIFLNISIGEIKLALTIALFMLIIAILTLFSIKFISGLR